MTTITAATDPATEMTRLITDLRASNDQLEATYPATRPSNHRTPADPTPETVTAALTNFAFQLEAAYQRGREDERAGR